MFYFQAFLGIFTASRLFWILSSMCFRKSVFRPDVVIFSSLFFTLVGSSLFVSSQGLIDFSKMLSIATKTSLGPLNFEENNENQVPTTLSDGQASLWIGIVMQAVILNMVVIIVILVVGSFSESFQSFSNFTHFRLDCPPFCPAPLSGVNHTWSCRVKLWP